jgi:hypothetical protein
MRVLIANVGRYSIYMRSTYGKCTITALPFKISKFGGFCFHPFARIGFYFHEQFCQRHSGCQAAQDMNMVGKAAYFNGGTTQFVACCRQIGVQFLLSWCKDAGGAVLGAEYYMNVILYERLSHATGITPFQGCDGILYALARALPIFVTYCVPLARALPMPEVCRPVGTERWCINGVYVCSFPSSCKSPP